MSSERPPPPARRVLRYDDLVLESEAPEGGDLAWLAEFLGPAFEPAKGPAGTRVALRVDPAEQARLRAALDAAPHEEVEALTLDGSFTRHRALREPSGRRWALEAAHDLLYGADPARRAYAVVATAGGPLARLGLMRLVREVATVAALGAGRLPLHAAAFLHRDVAWAVCGPKRSGKTTLLLHALSRGHALLANDRLFADPEGRRPARAMATIVMLREGTLARFPALDAALRAARPDRARTIAECAPGVERPEPRPAPGMDRPGLSAAQLAHLLDVPTAGAAPLGGLLFPVVDPEARGLVLEPLPEARAAEALARSLLAPSRPTRPSPLVAGDGAGPVDPAAEAEGCRALAARVPALRCRLGPDAYEGDLGAALDGVSAPRGRRSPRPRT